MKKENGRQKPNDKPGANRGRAGGWSEKAKGGGGTRRWLWNAQYYYRVGPLHSIIITILEFEVCNIACSQAFYWAGVENILCAKSLPDASWILQIGIIFSVACTFQHFMRRSPGIWTSSDWRSECARNAASLCLVSEVIVNAYCLSCWLCGGRCAEWKMSFQQP